MISKSVKLTGWLSVLVGKGCLLVLVFLVAVMLGTVISSILYPMAGLATEIHSIGGFQW
jgi:hypothetical protein